MSLRASRLTFLVVGEFEELRRGGCSHLLFRFFLPPPTGALAAVCGGRPEVGVGNFGVASWGTREMHTAKQGLTSSVNLLYVSLQHQAALDDFREDVVHLVFPPRCVMRCNVEKLLRN